MKIILFLFIYIGFCSQAFATNYCADANNVGCFLMEDSGTETDRGSNTANDLTVTNSPNSIPQATARFGSWSRDFEADDTEYLEHADGLATDLSGADQKMSIVASIKMETDFVNSPVVSKFFAATGSDQYQLSVDTGRQLNGWLDNNTSWPYILADGGSAIVAGTWYEVAMVYNDVTLKTYTDGSEQASTNHTTGISTGAATFDIGYGGNLPPASGVNYYDGLIDEVGIFSRDLTTTEISDIDTNGLGWVATATRRVIFIN